MSKLEEAAKKEAGYEHGVIRVPIVYRENVTEEERYQDAKKRAQAAYEAMFIAGAKWLLEEAKKAYIAEHERLTHEHKDTINAGLLGASQNQSGRLRQILEDFEILKTLIGEE